MGGRRGAVRRRRDGPAGIDWPDFRQVDLLLAVRPEDRRLWTSKPASKLFNSWLAGVPALLGPEHAYRELRRSELDYLEVSSLAEAKAAVLRLLERPDLYQAMVENGRDRGAEFTAEATLSRWDEPLEQEDPGPGLLPLQLPPAPPGPGGGANAASSRHPAARPVRPRGRTSTDEHGEAGASWRPRPGLSRTRAAFAVRKPRPPLLLEERGRGSG